MALSKEIYKEFEDVVGEENICDDPAIMPSYYNTEFAAVILPGNTLEVQALVKLCNKHRLSSGPSARGGRGCSPRALSCSTCAG
jgi:FAD/FMN-containing dehydrogenase